MEKLICFIMVMLLASAPGGNPKQDTGANWYIRHTNSHEKPVCDRRFAYIGDYDAFYIDPNAGDDNKTIYLTFDAGYENGNIEKTLDILKQENVPAAFFILDNLIYRNCSLLKRMVNEGHLVCNHTTKHRDMSCVDEETFKAELNKMEKLYFERLGQNISKYYRPPEGRFAELNLKWAEDMGYKTVLWSFAYPDWDNGRQPEPEKSKEKILSNTHPGEILLLHPTSETNVLILRDLICEWRKMGYRFGTLDDLIKSKE